MSAKKQQLTTLTFTATQSLSCYKFFSRRKCTSLFKIAANKPDSLFVPIDNSSFFRTFLASSKSTKVFVVYTWATVTHWAIIAPLGNNRRTSSFTFQSSSNKSIPFLLCYPPVHPNSHTHKMNRQNVGEEVGAVTGAIKINKTHGTAGHGDTQGRWPVASWPGSFSLLLPHSKKSSNNNALMV